MIDILGIKNQRKRSPYILFGSSVLIVLALAAILVLIANASTPLSIAGFFDFSYGGALKGGDGEPTAEKPESKLWWNDGFWWGVLYSNDAGEYRIYRLNWGEQTWEDTGVFVDEREDAHTDVLWDETVQKLYIVSNFSKSNPTHTSVVAERGRFHRFSYDQDSETYSLDADFPKTVNEDKTETLVVEKDSTGRMWVTFVGADPDPSIDPLRKTVQVNYANDDAAVWNTQFRVPVSGTENIVDVDDISSIISFTDDEGPKIGVMWSNQLDGNFYFATHLDASAPNAGWSLETIAFPFNFVPNDHINLAKNAAGQVFAAIKTENLDDSDASIGIIARDTDGTYSFHEFSDVASNDTRPIVVYNQSDNKVYLFVTSNEIGGRICYKAATVVSPLANMQFPAGNCLDGPVSNGAPFFIADEGKDLVNNATSTKQIVNDTTGLAVLASDDANGYVYLHNVMGDPPPVITSRSPTRNAVDVPLGSVVKATFSKPMNQATLTTGNFTVSDSVGPILGSVSYEDSTRTATFTPDSPLVATTVYTVGVTTAVQDSGGLGLFETESWVFTTGLAETPVTPTVQFSQPNYSVNEDAGTATITVNLSESTTVDVSVDYHTSNDTAVASSDYVAASGTLNFAAGVTTQTFNVTITDDALDEASETVRLTLTNPTNAVFADEMTQANALLTIEDNDEPVSVMFSASEFVVAEDGGSAEIVIDLSGPSGQTVSIDYATTDGTATAGADYTSVSATTLVFNPGETSKSFFVPITDDSDVEGNETVGLTLSNANDATLGSPSSAVLTIIDDESAAATVQFANANYQVGEGDGVSSVEVTLSNIVAQPVSVNYATGDGTATAGQDYTAGSGTLTFSPGETSKIVSIPILDDGIGEDVESFTVTLSSPVGAPLGTQTVATVEILDNDRIFLPIVFRNN